MPENVKTPGVATVGDGSPDKNASPAPAGEGSELSKILEQMQARDKTIDERFDTDRKERDNLRSLHDRQMTAIQKLLTGSPKASQEGEGEGGSEAAPATPEPQKMSPRELAQDQQNSIIKFRQEFPDWNDYWKDIEAIGSDQAKARPFVRYKADPDTGDLVPDYFASLVDIRSHLELERLRKAQEDAKPENQQAIQRTSQAKADAATIGGIPASIPEDQYADFKTLPYAEKVKKLAEWGFPMDPKDLPEALREG